MSRTIPRTGVKKDEDATSLREIVAPLFRRQKLLIATLVAVLVVAVPLGLHVLHTFRSQMAFLITNQRVDSPVTTGVPNQTITEDIAVAEEEINSEAEMVLSQDILEKVVVANHLADHHSWLSAILPSRTQDYRVASAVKTLARRIKVKPSIKANIIDVSFASDDPKLSQAVLDSLADFYLQKHAEVHHPQGSYNFFAAETDRYKKALDDSEAKLRTFSQTSGGAAPDAERADLDQQLTASIGQLHTTEQAIAAAEKRIQSDEAHMKTTPQRSTTQLASASPDMLLQQLGAAVLAAQTKRTQLALKYDPNYPTVREADQELAEAQAAYNKAEKTKYVTENTNVDPTYELLREDLARTQGDLAAQRASLSANQASIAKLQEQMAQLAQKNIDQTDLVREQKANESNYLLYMAKREQAKTSDALDKTKIDNVTVAIPPAIPVLPVMSVPAVLVLALVFSTFLSVMTAYCVDYLDSSFHTPDQVIDTLGIPVVISISKRLA